MRKTIHWIRATRSGALFRAVDRHGRVGKRLSARAVSDIVGDTISACLRTDPAGYSGHSLRPGFVTEARAHRVPDELIARHTRHTRPGQSRGGMLNRYDRPAELPRPTPSTRAGGDRGARGQGQCERLSISRHESRRAG